jgi:hypothetical protein
VTCGFRGRETKKFVLYSKSFVVFILPDCSDIAKEEAILRQDLVDILLLEVLGPLF